MNMDNLLEEKNNCNISLSYNYVGRAALSLASPS